MLLIEKKDVDVQVLIGNIRDALQGVEELLDQCIIDGIGDTDINLNFLPYNRTIQLLKLTLNRFEMFQIESYTDLYLLLRSYMKLYPYEIYNHVLEDADTYEISVVIDWVCDIMNTLDYVKIRDTSRKLTSNSIAWMRYGIRTIYLYRQ